jgi:hypothetical protein
MNFTFILYYIFVMMRLMLLDVNWISIREKKMINLPNERNFHQGKKNYIKIMKRSDNEWLKFNQTEIFLFIRKKKQRKEKLWTFFLCCLVFYYCLKTFENEKKNWEQKKIWENWNFHMFFSSFHNEEAKRKWKILINHRKIFILEKIFCNFLIFFLNFFFRIQHLFTEKKFKGNFLFLF